MNVEIVPWHLWSQNAIVKMPSNAQTKYLRFADYPKVEKYISSLPG
jgi:hypothetical protein